MASTPMSEDARKMIKRVDTWVEEAIQRERSGGKVFDNSRNRATVLTAAICKTSSRTVYKIRHDLETEEGKVSNELDRPKIELDDFDRCGLSRLILGFYKRIPPILPTLDMINTECQSLPRFPRMSKMTLYSHIKKLGFVVKKRNTKAIVYQKMDTVAYRHRYLMKIKEYRARDFKIFYQGETWLDVHHSREHVYQYAGVEDTGHLDSTTWKGSTREPNGIGRRIFVNEIGSIDGFLGCGECFLGGKSIAGHHKEMNDVHFEKWWVEKLLPALPQKAVVVIDDAKYHSRYSKESKTPTIKWRKNEIQDWLTSKNMKFDVKDTLPILLALSKEIVVEKQFILEQLTKSYCKKAEKEIYVLRIPKSHYELNAIELIWSQVKNEVARKNTSRFNHVTTVKDLMIAALNNVSIEHWRNAIDHVLNAEEAFRKVDFVDEDGASQFDKMVIQVSSHDSDTESDFSDDDL